MTRQCREPTARRNFGRGRRLGYAGVRALVEHYGAHDHYATRRAHGARFRVFADWLRVEYGIRDARRIERQHVEAYGEHLSRLVEAGQMAISYAQNRLSTVNRVLEILRRSRRRSSGCNGRAMPGPPAWCCCAERSGCGYAKPRWRISIGSSARRSVQGRYGFLRAPKGEGTRTIASSRWGRDSGRRYAPRCNTGRPAAETF